MATLIGWQLHCILRYYRSGLGALIRTLVPPITCYERDHFNLKLPKCEEMSVFRNNHVRKQETGSDRTIPAFPHFSLVLFFFRAQYLMQISIKTATFSLKMQRDSSMFWV